VQYHVLTGNLQAIAADLYFREPGDCIVPVRSANALGFPNDAPYSVSHVGVGAVCFNPGELADATIQARVAALLAQSNGLAAPTIGAAAQPSSVVAAASAPPAPPSSAIASQSGVIANGGTVDFGVAIPAGEPSGGFFFKAPADPSAILTFALLRPGGAPVATNDAGVTYDSGSGFGGLTETHYVVANPAAGTWIMRVSGTTLPQSGWPYDLQALVLGGISVTAKAGAGHYDVGQPFALSADVAVNATPYAGATVGATITKPDGTTATVALTDIGGGAYTGSFSDTAACGLYQVTITAGGSDSGTPFSRQDRTIAFAGVPGNVILDPCNADSDGDGLTDNSEVDLTNSNPANADTDGDGVSDGPLGLAGPPIVAPGPDNCVLIPNADQLDSNGNGIGNACEAASPVSVGGIAEQPDVATLPAAAASGHGSTAYIPGVIVLLAVAIISVGGWYVRRKRAV
jgi:hypothetical protein